jgi:multiple sugar transport system substrate-binding protein
MARALRALLTACALCACKRGDESRPRAEVTLQAFGDPAELAAYRALIDAFGKKRPDVRVSLIPVGQQKDHMAKLVIAFSAGTPPDLFLINYRRFGQLEAKGVLEPLGPLLTPAGLKETDLFAQAVEAFRVNGTMVCAPQNVSSLVVYVNTRLFREAGLPLPVAGWTWDDFARTARALTRDTNGDGRPEVHGVGFEPTVARLAPFIWQGGGQLLDHPQAPTRFMLDSVASSAGPRLLLNLRRVDKAIPELAEARAEDLEARFANGRLGMLLHSRRLVPTLRQLPKLEWDVAPLPKNVREATVLHSDAYCLSRTSRAMDEAVAFVAFALGPEGARLLAASGRTVPSLREVAVSPAFLDPSRPPASAKVFLDSIPHLERLPNIAAWNEIETRADTVVEEWFYAPGRTSSAAAPRTDGGTPPEFQGSMKAALRSGDDATLLGRELNEATRTLFLAPGASP